MVSVRKLHYEYVFKKLIKGCFKIWWQCILVMSSTAGIDTGIIILISNEVSITEIRIAMRYQKVSFPGLDVKIRDRKVSIPECRVYPN